MRTTAATTPDKRDKLEVISGFISIFVVLLKVLISFFLFLAFEQSYLSGAQQSPVFNMLDWSVLKHRGVDMQLFAAFISTEPFYCSNKLKQKWIMKNVVLIICFCSSIINICVVKYCSFDAVTRGSAFICTSPTPNSDQEDFLAEYCCSNWDTVSSATFNRRLSFICGVKNIYVFFNSRITSLSLTTSRK